MGYIAKHSVSSRQNIPSGQRMEMSLFHETLREHRYVISPNGDRPECFRHYEALGLGTIPITELDPVLHRHLAAGPVIFSESSWNVTQLELLPSNMTVNRNLIFEEYWLEYVERIVGAPLRWWDNKQLRTILLSELTASFSPTYEGVRLGGGKVSDGSESKWGAFQNCLVLITTYLLLALENYWGENTNHRFNCFSTISSATVHAIWNYCALKSWQADTH